MGNRRHFAVIVLIAALAVAGTSWRRALAASPAGPPLVAPDTLMETGLYEAGRPGVVAARNQPFSPQYPLWSDGASKRRWIFLPAGATIDASDAYEWNFPVGTKLWKEFAFGGRKVETRFLWKTSDAEWAFASYVWNADGTSADEGTRGRPAASGRDRARQVAQHPVAHRVPCLPRVESHRSAGLQRAAALHGSRSECDSWRTARARHGDPGDARERRTPDAGADRPGDDTRRASRRRARTSDRCSAISPATAASATTARPTWRRSACTGSRASWRRPARIRRSDCWRTARSGRCRACPKARAC